MPLRSLEPGFVGAWHAVPHTQRRSSKYLDYLRRMILAYHSRQSPQITDLRGFKYQTKV